MSISLHQGDIPSDLTFGTSVAVDTEAMGLRHTRDRLCLVQLSSGDGTAHLVQFKRGEYHAPNLVKLLSDPKVTKLIHFARFDVSILKAYLGVTVSPIYCTKIASKLARTYTDRHGLKNLIQELLGFDISKHQQSSDWGAEVLTEAQQTYAASDVLHLHELKSKLDAMLIREERLPIAQACFDFLPTRADLDNMDMGDMDIFAHS